METMEQQVQLEVIEEGREDTDKLGPCCSSAQART